MNQVFETISKIGIVPVIQIDKAESAAQLAGALIAGGLPCAEITFRTDAAEAGIREIAKSRPDMLVGAGTVLSEEQVKRAVDAGAKFVVSPGFNPKVVSYCLQNDIPVLPGVSNASDIEQALEFGLTELKFFPAEAGGGLKYLKALSAPYGKIMFMPTGGINAENVNEYLAFDHVFACGGSWMVNPKLINAGDFSSIEKLTREAVLLMLGFKLVHVGINSENSTQAENIARLLCGVLGTPLIDKTKSVFAGDCIEVMKIPYFGKNGHIGFKCNSLIRAVFYLQSRGVEFHPDGMNRDAAGNMTLAYLKDEFGGFAIHFVEK